MIFTLDKLSNYYCSRCTRAIKHLASVSGKKAAISYQLINSYLLALLALFCQISSWKTNGTILRTIDAIFFLNLSPPHRLPPHGKPCIQELKHGWPNNFFKFIFICYHMILLSLHSKMGSMTPQSGGDSPRNSEISSAATFRTKIYQIVQNKGIQC